MKDSQQSLQAWTNQKEQTEQEEQEYSQQFEKGYKLYQLSSQLNTAHLQIQKLSIDFQKVRREDRKILQKMIKQRDEFQMKYENSQAELAKMNTIQQAEKAARKKLISSNKSLKQEIKIISQRLGLKSNSLQSIATQITKLKDIKKGQEQTIQMLNSNLTSLKVEQQQNRIKNQIAFNKMKEALQEKILSIQMELSKEKSNRRNLEIVEQELQDTAKKLLEAQVMLEEKLIAYQSLKNQINSKQQELKSLKLKQDIWTITRERNRDEKIKFDQKIGQLQFQLNLSFKKIQTCEQKYAQQSTKAKRLDGIVQEYMRQIRKRQNEQIILQQQCQQIKKKLYVSDIYKDKYHKIHSKLKEQEERANHFANIAQQYAHQIQELQDSLYSAQSKVEQLQSQVNQLNIQTTEKINQLTSINLILTQQSQTIKQKNSQISSLKAQVIGYNKKIALLQKQKSKQNQISNIIQSEGMLDEIKKKVSIHYERLFSEEESIRRSLQNEVNSAKFTICELKCKISTLQKELSQQRQDKQLSKIENQRLNHLQFQSQRQHQKKIGEIRDTYRSMEKVKSEKCFKVFRKLELSSCFSFCLFNQYLNDKQYRTKITQKCVQNPSKDIKQRKEIYKAINFSEDRKSNQIDARIENKIIQIKQNNLIIRKQLND